MGMLAYLAAMADLPIICISHLSHREALIVQGGSERNCPRPMGSRGVAKVFEQDLGLKWRPT